MAERRRYLRRTCSLDRLPLDRIPDPRSIQSDKANGEADNAARLALAERLVGTLKPRDQVIVRSWFGLGEPSADFSGIARRVGLSRQAVRKRVPYLLDLLRRKSVKVM